MDKSIYELDLHETLQTKGQYICRVPGGWIYSPIEDDSYAVFVPYSNDLNENSNEWEVGLLNPIGC